MTKTLAVGSATGLFAVWALATYLLEARLGTFLRPDATSRFVYTVVANVLIGTIGAALVIRALVRRAELPRVTTYGIARPLRILVLVPIAALVGGLFLAGQGLPTSDRVILANAFAQVLVVSIAEVVVCWALLGAVLRNALGSGLGSAVITSLLPRSYLVSIISPTVRRSTHRPWCCCCRELGSRPESFSFSAVTCTARLCCTTPSRFAA